MYQVAMKFWNEIAASQPLSQPWATLFRLKFEELSEAMDRLVYRPAEHAGADNRTQLAFGLVAPLLLENEAISAYIDETDQVWLRAALPEVNIVEEAVQIAKLECRLDREQTECLARLLDAALLAAQGIEGHPNECDSAPTDDFEDAPAATKTPDVLDVAIAYVIPEALDPAYKLELDFGDLSKALRTLAPRKRLSVAAQDVQLDIGFEEGEVVFSTPGRQVRCNAMGVWPGYATCALRHAPGIGTFKPRNAAVAITFQSGHVLFESLRIPARWQGASQLAASISLEANFQEAFAALTKLYCPACGCRAGIHLSNHTPNPRRPKIDELIMALVDHPDASHGCTKCGHGWMELLARPDRQMKLW